MPFVRIKRRNRIEGKSVEPGDVIEVTESIAQNLYRIDHAEPFERVKHANLGSSGRWVLEKT